MKPTFSNSNTTSSMQGISPHRVTRTDEQLVTEEDISLAELEDKTAPKVPQEHEETSKEGPEEKNTNP